MDQLGDPGTVLVIVSALAAAGAAVGFLAGLFGVGGGAISVPIFYEIFKFLGFGPDVAMPTAVGTSLAVIVPTSISSARGHYLKGTLDLDVLRLWAVPVLIGVLAGAVIARSAQPFVFQLVFIAIAGMLGTKLLTGGKGWRLSDSLPARAMMWLYGAAIGLASALMGVGGGALSSLVLTMHGRPIHHAVSTSAGVGILIAIPGTLGYMAAGAGRPDLLPDAIGFVSLATFALTVPASLLTARLGVRLAHRMSRRALESAFGLFLLTACIRFVFEMAR